MISVLRGPLVLTEDISIVPLKELPGDLRSQIGGEEDDFTISRPRSRQIGKLISGSTAALLENFREPLTIVRAVARYSRKYQLNPQETLVEILPILRQLIGGGFLLPQNAKDLEPIRPALNSTTDFAGYHLLHCVQGLDDSELYLARNNAGAFAALKLARAGREKVLKPRLKREAMVLQKLDGRVNPELLESGVIGGRPYLALTWCPGTDAAAAAAELRSAGDQAALACLLANIAKAYATLHRQGVVHCDVHPGNVLVSRNGAVTLIDFGLADFINGDALALPRGGVAFFYEPELARALLNKRRPSRAHPLGEQFNVAALFYLLATGNHYFDFTLENKAMLHQIITERPASFRERGLEPWPELESVLARALAKKPEHRYLDMAAFAEALASITPLTTKITVFPDESCGKLIQRMLDSLQADGEWFRKGLETAPSCSVNLGMAGIAYALYRMASARQDPQLLALADLWISKTLRHQDGPDAFTNADLDLTPDTIGRISPYHTASGPLVVRALLAQSVGNLAELESARGGFLAAIEQPNSRRSLALGTLGVVLACTLLLEKSPLTDWPLAEVLRTTGQERLDQVWAEVENFASLETGNDWSNLGIAHGWAGLLYTTLRWHVVTGAPVPEGVRRRMAELFNCARPAGRGLAWPWRGKKGGGETTLPGWCNGAAGMVHLGCLAHRVLGDDLYLALAEGAAWQAWETGQGGVDLCCGLAGRAYALLCLYQHSEGTVWLRRAQILAQRAARLSPGLYAPDHPRHSLYQGELGVTVLLTEMERPEAASMPMFGKEG